MDLPLPVPKLVYVRPTDASTAFGKPADVMTVSGCRWPISDDGPWLFCNAEQALGCPYCEIHQALSRRQT